MTTPPPTHPDFVDVTCPMPGCDGALYIEWTSTYGLIAADLTKRALPPKPEDAHATHWTIACAEGHTVLVPGDPSCGCDAPESADCGHDPEQFDWADDSRTFRPHDTVRLRELIEQLSGVSA